MDFDASQFMMNYVVTTQQISAIKGDTRLKQEEKMILAAIPNLYSRWVVYQFLIQNTDKKIERKIVFSDKITIIFQENDTDKIQLIISILLGYINNFNFEALEKIKKYYIYPDNGFFGNTREIPYENSEKEKKALESLKALKTLRGNLQEKIYLDKSTFSKIVNEYICDFLGIDSIPGSQLTVQPITDEAHLIDNKCQTNDVGYEVLGYDDIDDGLPHAENGSLSQETRNPAQTTLFNDKDGKGMIKAGRFNLLYSSRGVGKTYMAIEIAKSPLVKNPLFIMLDDMSDEQIPRIKHPKLHNKIALIDYTEWEKRRKDIKNEMESQALNQAIGEQLEEYAGLSIFHKLNQRKEQILKDLGWAEKILAGNVFLLDRIFHEAVREGQDLIIIDSLQGLKKNVSHLTYEDMQQIIKVPIKNKITLLLLHHENEEGKIKGSKAVLDISSYVYRLRKDENDKTKLYLDNEKARSDQGENTFVITRTFEDDFFATHTIISYEDTSPLETQKDGTKLDKLKAVLRKHTTITREKFHQEVGGELSTLNNDLIKLGNEGFIRMADGRTWNTIAITANEAKTENPIEDQKPDDEIAP